MKSKVFYAIAESDLIFRKTVCDMICRNPCYHLKFSAGNGYELIRSFSQVYPDVLLVDLYMPVLSGMEAINLIKKINPSINIFCWSPTFQQDVFNSLSSFPYVIYCEKDTVSIVEVMDKYFREGINFYPAYIDQWKKRSAEKVNALLSLQEMNFSPAELRLMKLTYEGFTNKEIAEKMCLSKRTVDTYINRLTERLGLRTKTDLIKYTVDNGIYNTSL